MHRTAENQRLPLSKDPPSGSQLGNISCFYSNRYTQCNRTAENHYCHEASGFLLGTEKLETIIDWRWYAHGGPCHSKPNFHCWLKPRDHYQHQQGIFEAKESRKEFNKELIGLPAHLQLLHAVVNGNLPPQVQNKLTCTLICLCSKNKLFPSVYIYVYIYVCLFVCLQ